MIKFIISIALISVCSVSHAGIDPGPIELPLAISSGGTGQTTQQLALDAIAGAITSGRFLRGDGTHVTLSAIQATDLPSTAVTPGAYTSANITVDQQGRVTAAANGSGGGGSPGGSNTEVQFNNSGAFGADAQFVWLTSDHSLRVGTGANTAGYQLQVVGQAAVSNFVAGDWLVAPAAGWMSIGNFNLDQTDATNYAMIQDSSGETYLNSKTSKQFHIRQGNSDKMIVTTGGDLQFSGNVLPSSDNSLDLGSSAKSWHDIWVDNLIRSSGDLNFVSPNAITSFNGSAVSGVLSMSLRTNTNIVLSKQSGGLDYNYKFPNTNGVGTLYNDGSTNLIWVRVVPKKELFTLSGTDITHQYLCLANDAQADSVTFLVRGGGVQIEGASYDYSVSYTSGTCGGNAKITFLNGLATGGASALIAGDVVVAQYEY